MDTTTGQVIAASLNLRDGPNGDIVEGAVVLAGTRFQVLTDFGDGWPLVKVAVNGAQTLGFVDARFIAIDPPTAPPNPPPVSPGAAAGPKFTDNPNEVVTTRTTPAPADVVTSLRAVWIALNDIGARTLASQYMVETTGGANCFNWNLGNVKVFDPRFPHMYLKNVWECFSQSAAAAQIASAPELARLATADEIKKHGWSCPSAVVVFSPPHPQCRFRAYASLAEGATQWCQQYQSLATRNTALLHVVNAGDVAQFAHVLKLARYYSGQESNYADGLQARKAEIDRLLGPTA